MYAQTNQLSGSANCGDVPKPASAALSLLNNLRESQNETHEAIARLEMALGEVLAPAPPQPEGAGKAEDCAPSTSPLCEELERRLGVEHSACHRIQSLIDRLTV